MAGRSVKTPEKRRAARCEEFHLRARDAPVDPVELIDGRVLHVQLIEDAEQVEVLEEPWTLTEKTQVAEEGEWAVIKS